MSNRLRQNQPKVKVAQLAQRDIQAGFWFITLAAFATGVFYYWYYFTGVTGGVLLGN